MITSFKAYFQKFDAVLISSAINITYLTGYQGFSEIERECFLLITKDKNYLITDTRYSEELKKYTKDFEILEIGSIKFIYNDFQNILGSLKNKKIAIEKNDLRVNEFEMLKKHIKNIYEIELSKLRLIKRSDEIENIKKACFITDLVFENVLKKIKLNISELEIAKEIEIFIKKQNADFSFKPIVAFDKNSSIPHHHSDQTKLKKNQIILLDFGVKYNGYCSDMTRTVFYGKASSDLKKMYDTVLKAQEIAINKIKPKIKASEIDIAARNYIKSNNYPDIIHSLGHGIGLVVHESPHLSPKSNDILNNGMVFSVEPGIYIPNFGGIRIEDLVFINNGKPELISKSKREIIEIHA